MITLAVLALSVFLIVRTIKHYYSKGVEDGINIVAGSINKEDKWWDLF